MFMVTLEKRNLRKVVCVALVGIVLVGVWFGRKHALQEAESGAQNSIVQVTTTQDIQTFFTSYGIVIDQTDLSADRVQVPTTWDSSFEEFHALVEQSGYGLSELKGETIEKWVANIPAQSTGETMCYAVLLLKDSNIVGAYLLEKPSGIVTGLDDAVIAMAELRANIGAESSIAPEGESDTTSQEGADAPASADIIEEVSPEITVSLEVELEPNEEGYPVE